jgi:hypothetical protein
MRVPVVSALSGGNCGVGLGEESLERSSMGAGGSRGALREVGRGEDGNKQGTPGPVLMHMHGTLSGKRVITYACARPQVEWGRNQGTSALVLKDSTWYGEPVLKGSTCEVPWSAL